MRRVTLAALCAATMAGTTLAAAAPANAQPTRRTDVRADRRATAESIAAQYAAEQFRVNRIGDETTLRLLNENEAQRRKLAAVLKDARASAAQRDAARAELATLDAQLKEVNAKLLSSQQTSDELRAQLREYQRQITDAVDAASPEVAAAYELYAQGDRDTAYEIIDRLSQVEAAAARRAGEIRAGTLMRRPALLAYDRRDRGEMTLAQVIGAWERAQEADATYHKGWVDLSALYIEAGRLADARKAAEKSIATASNDVERGRAGGMLGEVLMISGDPRGAEQAWDKALKELKAAHAANPTDRDAARGVMAVLDRIGDMLMADLAFSSAAVYYGEELTLCRAQADPANIRSQRDLVVCLSKAGDAALNTGDMPRAKTLFEEMLATTRKVLATEPENRGYQRENALALLKMAEWYTVAGRHAEARPLVKEGLELTRKLSASDATSFVARRDLSVALNYQARVTDTRNAQGLKAYRALMEEAMQIRREMAAADPTNIQIQRDLALGLNEMAVRHIEFAEANRAPAELVYARTLQTESLAVYRRVAATPTADGHDQRRVSLAVRDLARVVWNMGDKAAAQPLWDEALAIRRQVADSNPNSALAHRDMGLILFDLGVLRAIERDWPGAAQWYGQAVDAFRKARQFDSADVNITHDLARALMRYGEANYELREFAIVEQAYPEAADLFFRVREARPDDPVAHKDFWGTLYIWAQMTNHPDAWRDTVRFMEEADAKGFMTAEDKGYLADARQRAKKAAEAAARPATGASQ